MGEESENNAKLSEKHGVDLAPQASDGGHLPEERYEMLRDDEVEDASLRRQLVKVGHGRLAV